MLATFNIRRSMYERKDEAREIRFIERRSRCACLGGVTMVTGYMHPLYAESLEEFGTPRELRRCRGWVLERQVPGLCHRDAMGCYPLFACQDWSQLHVDLEDLASDLVSVSLVTDPFGQYDRGCLDQCFKDVVLPFKEHFVIDLGPPMNTFVSQHHRRYAAKSFRDLSVERCEDPTLFIDEWIKLYATLIERRHISGIAKFSISAFTKQLRVPGIVSFRAVYNDTTVGMLLWYVQGEVGYYHLGAESALGYELLASFPLFWFSIEYFGNTALRWLDLGAGPGIRGSPTDGLSQFKKGWSNGTRTAYFCGRIFDHARYEEIVKAKGTCGTDYFPAYRRGEFG